MRYTHGNVSYGPLSGCLLILGGIIVAAALGGVLITIAAWPFLTPWPLWAQWATEVAYIPAAIIVAGLLAYAAGGHHGRPTPVSKPAPRDWSPPEDIGEAQHAPKVI